MNKLFYIPIIVFFVAGCAPATKCPVEFVSVPSYCDVELPKKPEFIEGDSDVQNLTNIIIYLDELEMALYCCTGDERCITRKEPHNFAVGNLGYKTEKLIKTP